MEHEIIIKDRATVYKTLDKPMARIIEVFTSEYDNENTQKNYRRYLNKYVGTVELDKLDDLNHISFADLREKSTGFIKSYKTSSTKRFVKSILSGFWNYIVDAYNYPKNPIARLRLEKVHNKSNTKSLPSLDLSKKLKTLYDYREFSQTDHLACALAYTLAGTSLRISEALQVTTDMVESGEITIKQKRGQIRGIELPIEVKEMLAEYCAKYNISGEVFKTKRGTVINRNNASRLLKKHTGISAHGFRKSVIEGLIEKGVHNHEVAKVSGHASINMVFYYDNRSNKTNVHKTFLTSLVCY